MKVTADVIEKEVDIEDVMSKFKIFGQYHGLAMVLLMLANISNSLYAFNYIFAAQEVNYRCNDTSDNYTCGDQGASECQTWIYDDPNSFVAEFDLACQDWKRTLVGSAHSFGYMLGLLVVGPLSDRFGRKTMLVVTGVMGSICGLARSFTSWYWLYIALEVCEAVIGDVYSPAYMLGLEIVSAKQRVIFLMTVGLGLPIGGIILPVLAWRFQYWRNYLRVIYTPSLLFLLYIYLADESPRWLLTRGEKDKAVKILKKATKWNKVNIEKTMLQNLTCRKEEKIGLVNLFKNTFSSIQLLKRFLVCLSWWITSTFIEYGMTINSVSLQGNKYLNYGLIWLMDIVVIIVGMYVLDRLKRKTSLISCFFIGAALCLAQPFAPANLPWLSIVLYTAGKCVASFFFSITYMYTSELFPTHTRNSMQALCSSLGRIGSIVAPQTPLLKKYWSGLPSIVFGSTALLAGLLTFLVPDTANNSLPDTVKEAEALGSKELKEIVQ